MDIGTLNIQLISDLSKLREDMQNAKRVTGDAMGSIEISMAGVKATIDSISAAEKERASLFSRTMTETKRLLDIAKNAANETAKSLEDLKLDPDALKVPPESLKSLKTWQDQLAFSAGAGSAIAADKAKKVWEDFKGFTERTVIIWGVALATGIAAVLLSAVYAAYKSISFGIGLITGESYKSENIDALIATNKEVKTLQDSLSIAAVDASALNEALKASGTDATAYTSTINGISTAVRSNSDELDRLGVKYKDQNGNVLANETILKNASFVLASYAQGWDRAQAAQAIGLGTEKQIQDALAITSEKVQIAKDRLVDYGLIIGVGTQEAVAKYEDSMRAFQRESDLTSQGFKRAIADNIMPVLTDLADFFRDGFPTAVLEFRYSLATITSLLYGLKTVVYIVSEVIVGSISAIGDVFGGVGQAMLKAAHGDFSGAKDALIKGWAEAKDSLGQIGDNIVAQARHNTDAMALAWGADSLGANQAADAIKKVGKAWKEAPGSDDKAYKAKIAMLDGLYKQEQANLIAHLQTLDTLHKVALLGDQEYENKRYAAQLDSLNKLKEIDQKKLADAQAADKVEDAAKFMAAIKELDNQVVLEAQKHNDNLIAIEQHTQDIITANEVEALKARGDIVGAFKLEYYKRNGDEILKAERDNNQKLIDSIEQNYQAGLAAANYQAMVEQSDKVIKVWQDASNDIADSLGKAFGSAGKAASDMFAAYANNAIKQQAIDKELADNLLKANGDPTKVSAAQIKATNATTQAQVKSYADMASAAQGFFHEGTTGYKLLGDISTAFHLIEMAMAIQSMITNVTAAETKTAANIASIPPAVAAGGAQMFAQSGWGGFIGVAAMIAVMAALGFAGGGGGGSSPSIAEQRQASQGTGTVLGDSSAKSESILKAIEQLKNNSDLSLPISQGMLTSLQSIAAEMIGLAQVIFRTAGITSGNGLGISTGTIGTNKPGFISSIEGVVDGFQTKLSNFADFGITGSIANIVSKIAGGIFGKTSQSITDSGLSIGGMLGNVSQGQGISQYANVHQDTSSFWGLSHSSSDSTVTGAVDATISDQVGKVFKGISDTLLLASSTFVSDTTGIQKQLQDYIVSLPNISLRGLTGQALQDALNAVFSSFSDTLAHQIIPGMDDFQQVGEGYFQTLIRVVNGVESAKAALDKFGITAINFADIVNKQGDIAVEIMRQSIDKVETAGSYRITNATSQTLVTVLTGVGKIIDAFSGSASDLAALYQSLLDLRKLMGDTNLNGNDLSASTIQGAGGLDQLKTGLSDYLDKYFTPSEKATAQIKDLSKAFGLLGLQMPTTKDAFRALIGSIDTTTDYGAKLAGSLVALAGPYSDMIDAISAGNDEIQATIDGFKAFSDTLLKFRDSLLLGNLSTLTPEQKYAEAAAQYQKTLAAANNGDTSAQSGLTAAMNTFLQASQVVNASGAQYQADFAKVLADIDNSSAHALMQATIAQASLDTLNLQLTTLNSINTNMVSFIDYISGSKSTSGTIGSSDMMTINGSHAGGLPYVPFNGYIAELHRGEAVLTANQAIDYRNMGNLDMAPLANEIKALRAEVSALRADQAQQTGALITSNYDANDRAADKVAAGSKDAAKDMVWAAKSKAALV